MPELSPVTQAWIQVVLVWIGFGSLAGLLARVLLPFREPSNPLAPLTLGITGSAVGLGALSWLQNGGPSNPISPIGFLAASGGAIGLLLVYHMLRLTVHRNRAAEAKVEPASGARKRQRTWNSQGFFTSNKLPSCPPTMSREPRSSGPVPSGQPALTLPNSFPSAAATRQTTPLCDDR